MDVARFDFLSGGEDRSLGVKTRRIQAGSDQVKDMSITFPFSAITPVSFLLKLYFHRYALLIKHIRNFLRLMCAFYRGLVHSTADLGIGFYQILPAAFLI